jgi:hypothetical protein
MNIDNSEIKYSDFDKSNQCRYTDDYLERIFPEIIGWPTPLMAKCVDQDTFMLVGSSHPIEVKDELSHEDYELLDAKSLGNLAYISLYHPDKETGRKAQKLITEIRSNYLHNKLKKDSLFRMRFDAETNTLLASKY